MCVFAEFDEYELGWVCEGGVACFASWVSSITMLSFLGINYNGGSGRFVVAEVTSRFRDTEAFTKLLSELGFELIEQVWRI